MGRAAPQSPFELAQQRQPYPEPSSTTNWKPQFAGAAPEWPGRASQRAQAATGQRIGAVEGQANQNQDRTERGELDGQANRLRG